MTRRRIGRGAAATTGMLAAAAVLTACSSDGSATGATGSGPVSASAAVSDEVAGGLTVYRPGMVDTPVTADELPEWPGPDPADLLTPDPGGPVPESGTITDPAVARRVYLAAIDNGAVLAPGQVPAEVHGGLWAVGGVVDWLVVEPAG